MISVIDINPNHQRHSGPPPQRRRFSMLSLNWALKLLIRVFKSCHTAMSFGGWKTNDVHMLGFLKISQKWPFIQFQDSWDVNPRAGLVSSLVKVVLGTCYKTYVLDLVALVAPALVTLSFSSSGFTLVMATQEAACGPRNRNIIQIQWGIPWGYNENLMRI